MRMVTASLVLYKSKPSEVERVLSCVDKSIIDIVYCVDNSPEDSLRYIVGSSCSKAVYIYGQGNVGFGGGNNIGIEKAIEAESKYHVILNPDIVFEANVIEHLASYMNQHIDVGVIKPQLAHCDMSFEGTAMLLPTPFDTFGRRLLPQNWVERINYKFELRNQDLSVVRNVPVFSGSFLFIRTSIFKIVGLFDDQFFMYFEDFDLVRRIHKICKTVFYPKDIVIHAHAAEHKSNKKLLMISIISAIKYYNKWGWFIDRDRRVWNKEAQSNKSILE